MRFYRHSSSITTTWGFLLLSNSPAFAISLLPNVLQQLRFRTFPHREKYIQKKIQGLSCHPLYFTPLKFPRRILTHISYVRLTTEVILSQVRRFVQIYTGPVPWLNIVRRRQLAGAFVRTPALGGMGMQRGIPYQLAPY